MSRSHPLIKRHKTSSIILKRAVLVVAIVEPLMTIPQIVQIWSTKSAEGVSLFSWASFLVSALIWLIYGWFIKDKPLVVASFLWVVTESAVIAGILIY